ncbi:MAG: signal transduction histidine kinase, partial [Gammaproteobacteria bacterium]
MKHLSLAKQLSISFSFIGLVLIGTFTTVYYKVQVLNSDAVSVQNLRIPTSLASQQLQKGIHQSLAALRGWTSLNDDQFKLERNLAWQQEIWQPLNKLNRLSANWTNPANITRLARIEKNILKLEEYQQAVENIANTLDSTPALKILIQDAAPLATRMLKNISDLIEIEAAMPAKADRGRLFKQFADFRGSFSLGIAEISLFLLSQQQQHKSLFDEHWLANEQLLGVIEGSLFLLTTEQKTLFIELLSEWKKFRLLPEKIFQIQQSEVNNLAKFWLGTKAAPEAVKILNDLDKITLDQKRDLRLGFIEHEKLINRLYLNLAILLGVSLILLIGVGSYLVREITIPVNQAILIAQEVGKGNTSIDINLTGAEEIRVLGAALKKMSVELTEASSQKGRQYWVAESLREINDIVQGQTDIEKMASATCLYLAAHLNLQTLHFYINDGVSLRLVGSYPLDDSDASKNKTAFGVETVDHGVLEGFPISPINVPSSYTRINSETSPCHIVVAPFTVGNEVYGVMEIGTSEPLSEVEIELLDLLDKRIGIVIRSIFKQTKTQNLLLKSQTYSDELQQEELRVTNVELQERTKGLQTSEEDLRAQTEELQIINVELQEKSELLGKQYTEAEQARQMIRIEAEKLERVSRYKSEFLANMSHELRTPLNSLLILSKLLSDNKNGNLTEKQVEFAATIYNSGNDLLTIIGDILDLSKVEAGKLDINIENIDIPALVKKISVNLKPLFKQKNLKFKIIVETNCPQTIQTDAGRLEQIIKNLLSNAQKFTDKGRVTLTVGRPLKSIILTRNNLRPQGCIAFSIVDTGIGIPADKQALIFDAFQQVDSGTTRKYGGTGLGLSITRELVNLLHGEIQVTSVEGKGSTFTIFLNETASQDNVMASGPVEASITHQLTNQTIKPEGQVDTDEEISVLIFKGDPV